MTILQKYKGGLQTYRSSPTSLGINRGTAADALGIAYIDNPTDGFVKTLSGAWTAGSGNAGLGNGVTLANGKTLHLFAIISGGAFDAYFDSDPAAANRPAGTTSWRRIASMPLSRTLIDSYDSSVIMVGDATIPPYTQHGNRFCLGMPLPCVPASFQNPGSGRVQLLLPIPVGVTVRPLCHMIHRLSHQNWILYQSPEQSPYALVHDTSYMLKSIGGDVSNATTYYIISYPLPESLHTSDGSCWFQFDRSDAQDFVSPRTHGWEDAFED